MSTRTSRWAWISQRRGDRVRPVGRSDLGPFQVIGAIILAVALVMTAFYALDFDFAAYTTFRGELHVARGTVVAVEPTDSFEPENQAMRSRRSRLDTRPRIMAVRYSFVGTDRVEHHGVSYRPNSPLKADDAVTIEHPAGRAEVSRIRGYRSAKLDTLPIGLPIMGGVGIVLLAVGRFWRVGRRHRDDS